MPGASEEEEIAVVRENLGRAALAGAVRDGSLGSALLKDATSCFLLLCSQRLQKRLKKRLKTRQQKRLIKRKAEETQK